MQVCALCGQENPEGARFCNACAAPLAAEQPTAAKSARSSRFSSPISSASPDERSSSTRRTCAACSRPTTGACGRRSSASAGRWRIHRRRGHGGLRGAVAHEDDPERAVRAALAVREAILELNEADPALDLHVRIAVNTGEAVVALGARRPRAKDGRRRRRQHGRAAPDGGAGRRILVGEATYRATERTIEYGQAEPVRAKGKSEPIPVWEAFAARARYGVDVQQTGGAPLVGRREELDLLSDALGRAERERTPQLLTLVGVPGIGKSRLVWELAQAVDADPTSSSSGDRAARCPTARASPSGQWRRWSRRRRQSSRPTPPRSLRRSFAATVADLVPDRRARAGSRAICARSWA